MSEFTEYLRELFVPFGAIEARKMFGGYGIFHEGLMFGLVADDTLYLKADEVNAADFQSLGLGQFEYEKGAKLVKMSFFEAPTGIFDNPEDATLWAKNAYEAAVRTKRKRRG